MATSRELVDYVVGQLGPTASAKAMFGEYGVYLGGRLIGLVCDDRLFLKQNAAAASLLGEHECAPPYPRARPAIIVPEHLWDDRALMTRLAAATADALASLEKPAKRKSRQARS